MGGKSLNLTKSVEDYLEVMYILKNSKGSIKVKDIASRLDVKPPSVVQAVQKLSESGLVNYERYGDINLTDKGLEVAIEIFNKHDILKEFLTIFGIEKKIAEEDACSMEHILNPYTIQKMNKFVEFTKKNPETSNFIKSFQYFDRYGKILSNGSSKID
ncbi:MAG: metal-dependent transcriptional regulator [Methanobacteriaceae archaeon]